MNVHLGPKRNGSEDRVDPMGESVRRVVKRMPQDGSHVVDEHGLRPGVCLEGAVDDGHGVLRCSEDVPAHGGANVLDDVAASMVGVGSIRRESVEGLPHRRRRRPNGGH